MAQEANRTKEALELALAFVGSFTNDGVPFDLAGKYDHLIEEPEAVFQVVENALDAVLLEEAELLNPGDPPDLMSLYISHEHGFAVIEPERPDPLDFDDAAWID
jgi:hypothetical protein